MQNEIWEDIKGFEGKYQISNFGRVKSLQREIPNSSTFSGKYTVKEKILADRISSKGYLSVNISDGNKYYNLTVHCLVWDHFGSKKRNGIKLQVDHIDGNKQNNHINNLQLLTNRDNTSKYHRGRKLKKYVGVHYDKGKFTARIYIDGKYLYLGRFETEEEAHKAYMNKKNLNRMAIA